MDYTNIVIAGVGGQGTLVAGKFFGALAMNLGLDVKISEVHGMSQRGGSVVTYVRIGEEVFSPVVEKGKADFILAFEELEALRYADYLSEDGKLIVNLKNIIPVTVKIGSGKYPESISEKLKNNAGKMVKIFSIDADKIANDIGNNRTANIVMIGVMSAFSNIEKQFWIKSLEDIFPPKLIQINKTAFEMGRKAVKNK